MGKNLKGLNISYNLKEFINRDGVGCYYDDQYGNVLCFITEEHGSFEIKVKKGLMTLEWLFERLSAKNNNYVNYSNLFKQAKAKLAGYGTTQGISVSAMYNKELSEEVKKLAALLDKHNIKYRNEWSDRQWVYRFVISKEKGNLEKLRLLNKE